MAQSAPSTLTDPQGGLQQGGLQLEIAGLTKQFGALRALDDVSITVAAGSFHALLGENGAGKSTLVKCLVGFYKPDAGQIVIDRRAASIATPRDADAAGIGMVYQHFTLVPSMTVAENLVVSGGTLPGLINWRRARERLKGLLATLPFAIDLDARCAHLSAGEKQKIEIVKQLYLRRRLLILDEPTSVLTPAEARQLLGYVRELTRAGRLTAIMITHKFSEVTAFADTVSVLRRGRCVRSGAVADLSVAELGEAMVGAPVAASTGRRPRSARGRSDLRLSLRNLTVAGDHGPAAVPGLSLDVFAGEIVGIAGVSGNGQKELVEALMGQRPYSGSVTVDGEAFGGTRAEIARYRIYGLPQEPLKNASVPDLSLAENMALRNYDRAPLRRGIFLDRRAMARQAESFVAAFRVQASGLGARMATLSGGNVQRAVLARELSHPVRVLIASNPTFGLDFIACQETHARILAARNQGAGVLLLSEDLDELLELVDRIAVISGGRIVHTVAAETAEKAELGRHMAGG